MEFFVLSNVHLYIGLIISVINAGLMCFEGYKLMQVIQISGYHLRGYFDWLKDTRAKHIVRLAMLTLLSTMAILVTNVIFDPYAELLSYMGFVIYLVFSLIFISKIYKAPQKTPLKMTHRMNRYMILFYILSLILSFGLVALSSQFFDVYGYGAIALTPICLPLLVPFVHWLMKPTEKAISKRYVKKTKEKLKETPNLIKIGITGSFGKTSTKNFLNTLLSEKYSVCTTPANFNTPMGITKTVLQCLAPLHQVLIAEMGARKVGDIKELCEIVEPQYGIITAVGEQHMATFQSIDNIRRTKAELSDYLTLNNGYCVFDGDNEITRKIFESAKCDKGIIGIGNTECKIFADNIKVSTAGTNFDLHIDGMETVQVKTKLFGEHNVNNLLLCVDIAVKLGLNRDELVRGLARIMPVEHRLQLIQGENDVIILDDAYNASIEGSKRALEVMAMWKDRRKVVITPGLVELGTMERIANYELGKRIAKVANIVIIVNKVHYLSVKQGLLDEGFDESKIYSAENLNSAVVTLQEILQPKDVVLWENDLPDNYT